jgi:F0F1-type ATP synthase assembly protein I
MTPDDPKQSAGFLRQLSMAMELPFVLVGGVLIGGGIGWLLDRWMHTAPWLALVLGFLGFGAGIWEIIQRLTREEKKEERNGGG